MLPTKINSAQKFLLFLGAITLAGFILRLHGLGSESLTADEASALLRLQFPNFSSMIQNGVRPDGHPAFTQVLLWFWTKCFGVNEFVVRLPFAIFGTASIWLLGIIGKKLYNNTTALCAAAGMAFLQFPIMYSQLARPYAPGLFFTLLAAYFWVNFVKEKQVRKSDIAGFAIAAALAAYSHYFSLLTTTLLALSGLFFLGKEIRRKYLFACVFAVLLFLPHISITLHQLGIGGVGGPDGWLGKPTPKFFGDHLKFIFDGSRGMFLAVLTFWFLSMVVFRHNFSKMWIFSLKLWAVPLLIGYFYSVKVNPVLQDSCLLFGFPFLLLFIFGLLPDYSQKKFTAAIPAGFSILFLLYVTLYKPFHLTDHFGRLKELVSNTIDWQKKFGADKVNVAYNVDADYFVDYYYNKFGEKRKNILTTINDGKNELFTFRKLVENSDADYFVYGWSTKYSPLEIIPIIQEKFPYVIGKEEWFNSAIYLFSKQPVKNTISVANLFVTHNNFSDNSVTINSLTAIDPKDTLKKYSVTIADSLGHSPVVKWSDPCKIQLRDSSLIPTPEQLKRYDSLQKVNGPFTYSWTPAPWSFLNYDIRLDSSCIYSPALQMKAGDILKNPDNTILFSTSIKLQNKKSDLIMVIEFERDGKQLYWNGIESTTQVDTTKLAEWQNVYFGIPLPEDLKLSDSVKFYCYTKDGYPILIDYLEVKTLKGHRGIYGPHPDYQ